MEKVTLVLAGEEVDEKSLKKSLEYLFESTDIYKFSSSVNGLFTQCFNHKNFDIMADTLMIISDLQLASVSHYIHINFYEAFTVLLNNVSSKISGEIMARYLRRRNIPCERSLVKITEYLIKDKEMDVVKDLLLLIADLNKFGILSTNQIFSQLLIFQRIDICCLVLKKLPFKTMNLVFIWENFIDASCNCGQSKAVKDLITEMIPSFIPDNVKFLETVYNSVMKKLLQQNEKIFILLEFVDDIVNYKIPLLGNNLRVFLIRLLEKDTDIAVFIEYLKKLTYALDAFTISLIIKKLIMQNNGLFLLDIITLVFEGTLGVKLLDLKLPENDLKYILMLQYQYYHNENKTSSQLRLPELIEIQSNTDYSVIDKLSLD